MVVSNLGMKLNMLSARLLDIQDYIQQAQLDLIEARKMEEEEDDRGT